MAAMSDSELKATGLELLLPDPEFIAELSEKSRLELEKADDDGYEPPHAA
jgi:hypothetical protein